MVDLTAPAYSDNQFYASKFLVGWRFGLTNIVAEYQDSSSILLIDYEHIQIVDTILNWSSLLR